MNDEFITPINSESDLELYAKYLDQECPSSPSPSTMQNKLCSYIGKPIKVEVVSLYRTESKTGFLKQAGQDYILINQSHQRDMLIPFYAIKSITILQNDTKLPHF